MCSPACLWEFWLHLIWTEDIMTVTWIWLLEPQWSHETFKIIMLFRGDSVDGSISLFTVVILPCPDLSNTDTSSASEDEGSLRRQGRLATSTPYQGHSHPAIEHWFNRVIQGSSTSSSASSTSSHPGGRSFPNTTAHAALNANAAATALADLMAHTQLGQ